MLPCYNVERYITKCLDSIYSISLSELEYEVICVDDCSTDRTSQIITLYGVNHSNLRLIRHETNKASGGARNTGLRNAEGAYVWYVDPDDMICFEHLNAILDKCESGQLDVLGFNYTNIDEEQNIIDMPHVFSNTKILKGIDFVNEVFGDSIVHHIGYIWRFVYRREFLLKTNMFFPENVVWQDTVYMPRPLFLAERAQGLDVSAYLYWHHVTSVCGNFETQYPGKKIHTWTFSTGKNVLVFSKELEMINEHYANVFYQFARNYYFKKFPIFLCRTNRIERHLFYDLITEEDLKNVKQELPLIPKIFLLPVIGRWIADILAVVYRVKKSIS